MLLLFIMLIISTNSFYNISKEYLNLITWIESNSGYISKKVIPVESSKSNRFIKSIEKIEKNELISYIPEKVIISSINFLINPLCRKAYGLNHNSDLDCIALFLTLDRINSTSFFKPYYDYLPEFNIKDFPSEFPKEEQNLYDEIGLYLHIGIHDYKLKNAYNEYVDQILLENKIINGYEKFKYNYYLAHTRDFCRHNSEFFSDLNSIVPFMDLFNHDINFNLDWEYSDEKKGFIIKAIKNIDKDEILTTTDGKVDILNLFTVYEFTLKNNNIKTPIKIQIGEYKYSLYPDENENKNKLGIVNLITTLKERYGKDKEKEIFIC